MCFATFFFFSQSKKGSHHKNRSFEPLRLTVSTAIKIKMRGKVKKKENDKHYAHTPYINLYPEISLLLQHNIIMYMIITTNINQ